MALNRRLRSEAVADQPVAAALVLATMLTGAPRSSLPVSVTGAPKMGSSTQSQAIGAALVALYQSRS